MSKIIGYPLGLIMWLAYQVVQNYAWSIVIFTLITKILLFPLSVKQQKSQAIMTAFQPKLEKLKKQYGSNQQKIQEEQMKLYQEEGINPMASCLPLLIQLPILYGIFDVVYRPITHILRVGSDVLNKAIEITAGTHFGEVQSFNQRPEIYVLKAVQEFPQLFSDMPDFYEKASSFKNTLFGFIDLGAIPTFKPAVWDKSAIGLVCIAIASGLIQLIMTIYTQRRTKKMNPAATSNPAMGGMNAMLYGMPIFSIWIACSYPAGVGFYWAMSALFSFIQSIVLYKIYTPEYVAQIVEKDKLKRKKKNNNRTGIMQRYQELLEQQQATESAVKNNRTNPALASAKLSDDDDEDDSSDDNVSSDVKLSKSQQKEYERLIIAEARRKQAEKYGEEYIDEE